MTCVNTTWNKLLHISDKGHQPKKALLFPNSSFGRVYSSEAKYRPEPEKLESPGLLGETPADNV